MSQTVIVVDEGCESLHVEVVYVWDVVPGYVQILQSSVLSQCQEQFLNLECSQFVPANIQVNKTRSSIAFDDICQMLHTNLIKLTPSQLEFLQEASATQSIQYVIRSPRQNLASRQSEFLQVMRSFLSQKLIKRYLAALAPKLILRPNSQCLQSLNLQVCQRVQKVVELFI